MKRQLKMLGIISVCLLVFVVIWYFLDTSKEESNESKTAAGEQTLWETAQEEVAQVEVENESGGFCIIWEDDRAVLESVEGLPLNEGAVEALKGAASLIKSQKEIQNGKDRLSEFGLDEPEVQVRIKDKNGKEIEFFVGNPAPEQENKGRYVYLKDRVYLVAQNKMEIFENRSENFLSVEVTPSYEEDSESILVTKVVLNGDREDFTEEGSLIIEYSDSQELAGYQVKSYQITSPVEYPAEAGIAEEVIPSLFGITAEEITALYPEEEELASSGLDTPYLSVEVFYKDADDSAKTFVLDASRPDEEGNVFLKLRERSVIYSCDASQVPLLEMGTSDLISHEILAPDIRTLRRLTVRKNGEEASTVDLSNLGKDNAEVLYENKSIQPADFQNFYYGLISLSADEVLLEPAEDTSSMEQVAEVIFEYESGEQERVVYYQEETLQLYAVLNDNERGYRLSASEMERVLNDWKRLLNSEEIKARY